MRYNSYIQFKENDDVLKAFRVKDGQIRELEENEINAIRDIIAMYSLNPIDKRNNSIIYEDICDRYKNDFEKYLEAYYYNSVRISDNREKIPNNYTVNREKSRNINKGDIISENNKNLWGKGKTL